MGIGRGAIGRGAIVSGATALRVLGAIALIAYPAFVWLGLSAGSPRQVALLLLLVMLPALIFRVRKSARPEVRGLAAVPIAIVSVLVAGALLDRADYIRMTPVASNLVLLIAFGSTLRRGSMPMIERFARLQTDELGPPQLAWCRLWTWIWCGFFVANGTTALMLALWASTRWWALYNGLLCYLLIGGLFALEWLLRRRRFRELIERDAAKKKAQTRS